MIRITKEEQIENGENWIVEFWRVRGYNTVRSAMGISFKLYNNFGKEDKGLDLTYLEQFADEVIRRRDAKEVDDFNAQFYE